MDRVAGHRPCGPEGEGDMTMRKLSVCFGAIALLAAAAVSMPAQAGDSNGNFQVKVGVTGLIFDDNTTSTSARLDLARRK